MDMVDGHTVYLWVFSAWPIYLYCDNINGCDCIVARVHIYIYNVLQPKIRCKYLAEACARADHCACNSALHKQTQTKPVCNEWKWLKRWYTNRIERYFFHCCPINICAYIVHKHTETAKCSRYTPYTHARAHFSMGHTVILQCDSRPVVRVLIALA